MKKYDTIDVRIEQSVCFVRFNRAARGNTINARLIEECLNVLDTSPDGVTVLVFEGSPEVFCLGADFDEIGATVAGNGTGGSAGPIYDLWDTMTRAPYVCISHVRGRANAGGMGFIAASDIVLADEGAQFSLSEMLFGLFPACVLPFLIRRVGFQRAHYLTLTTQPISSAQALAWGLVDASAAQSEPLLRRHLTRLRVLSKKAIRRYKQYSSRLRPVGEREMALAANREVFSDPANLEAIVKYTNTGTLPWDQPQVR